MRELVLIAHNLRSAHNVGSLLRTADGLDAEVILTGYTPYPKNRHDTRLPHLAEKISKQISKTALGAQETSAWQHQEDIEAAISELRQQGYVIAALEQVEGSKKLPDYRPPDKLVIIVGREVEGLEPEIVSSCDLSLEIPMLGRKESFNVVQAAAIALYHCRYIG